MAKLDVLLEEMTTKINIFKKDSDKHKKMHRRFRYAAFVFTALSSVLAGLALYWPEHQTTVNICILLVGAIGGIIASVEGIRKPDELWIHERNTYFVLSDLKREVLYETEGQVDDERADYFFARFQQVLHNAGEKWNTGIVGNEGKKKVIGNKQN